MSDNSPEKTSKIRGENLVPFLAHLSEIQAECLAGWPIKSIYNRRAQVLDMSYTQFTRYVNQYIPEKPQKRKTASAVKAEKDPFPTIEKLPAEEKKEAGFKQFIPGPKDPNPKDLW
jgi:hypothetical protein